MTMICFPDAPSRFLRTDILVVSELWKLKITLTRECTQFIAEARR